jgi:hypothetical protein
MNVCLNCGIPIDAGIFDDSAIINITTPGEASPGRPQASLLPGEALELARFDLSPEHCGVLLSFAQYTDQYATSVKNVLTPGYLWEIRYDDQPLAPWLRFDRVINPWGLAGFPMAVRLQPESRLRLMIHNQNVPPTDAQHWLRQVGGRLVGRYWFDDEHAGRRQISTREPWR